MSSSGDFTYKTVDDKVYITSYTGTETEVVFPAEIDGKSVYGIDPNGRTNCVPNAKVTKVTISEGIQSLESCAFRGATVLTDISLPSTLTSIADHCFIWCYALQEIALPENLKRLGERCFYESIGLKSIKFPESLDALEEGTFINCRALSKAVFPENVKYNTIPKKFFSGCYALTSVNIPEQIETIGDESFDSCYSLKNITLPNGLKAIGYDAFFYTALKETLTVPKSVQIIGESAFYNTKISKLCVLCENATIGSSAFSGCEQLAEVELSDGITDIGNGAFSSCEKLSKIKIPRGVTELKNDVFKSCDNLESVEVHDKLTKIGGFTFEGCKKLTSFDFTHIMELGDRTFQSCGFKEVKIPGTLTNLGFAVFHWCSELESAELGDGIEEIRAPFAECHALKTVKLPSTLKRIAGVSDFNCCYELKSIELPDGLEEIADSTFDRTGLKSITIPDSVTKLGEGIFRECYNLESITLPKELKTVPDGLCNYCSSLKSISIPDSVTTIGNNAFSHTGLERFDGNKDLISIGNSAFSGCASLKQVTLQDSVTSIGEWAFSSAGIEEITLSQKLNTIKRHAFYCCRSLKSVTIPQHVRRLEVAVFANCDSLTDVYLHDNIYDIFIGGWQNPAAFADSPNVVIHCPNKYSTTARSAINRDLPIVFDSLSRNGETALIDEKNSGFLISNGSLIKLVCDYSFKPEVFENCKDPRVIIRVPRGLELIGGYFYLNDKTCTGFNYDSENNTYSVSVTDPSGKIVIGTTSDDKTYQLKAYAALQAGVNNSTVTETINLFNEYVEPVTISVENSTSTANISVTGNAPKGKDVNIYVSNTLCATVKSNMAGIYSTEISIPNPINTASYTIEAQTTDNKGKTVSAYGYTRYVEEKPKLVWFRLRANNRLYQETETTFDNWPEAKEMLRDQHENGYDLLNPNTKIVMTAAGASLYYYEMRFDKPVKAENIILTSTKDGKTATYNITWDKNRQAFRTNTILCDYDKKTEYIPSYEGIAAVTSSYSRGSRVADLRNLPYLPGRLGLCLRSEPIPAVINEAWTKNYINSIRIDNNKAKNTSIKVNADTPTHFNADISVNNNGKKASLNYETAQTDLGTYVSQNPEKAQSIINNGSVGGSSSGGSSSGGSSGGGSSGGSSGGGSSSGSSSGGSSSGGSSGGSSSDTPVNEQNTKDSITNSWNKSTDTNGNTVYSNSSYNENTGSVNLSVYNANNNTISSMDITPDFNEHLSLSDILEAAGVDEAWVDRASTIEDIFGLVSDGVDIYNDYRGEKAILDMLEKKRDSLDMSNPDNYWAKQELDRAIRMIKVDGFTYRLAAGTAALMQVIHTGNPITDYILGLCAQDMQDYLLPILMSNREWWERYGLDWYFGRGVFSPFTIVIDPSGYVYAGLESNRIQGAVATIYGIEYDDGKDDATFWDSPDESRQVKWDAVDYSQQNPLLTDPLGNYAWDVPEGWWRVEISAEGYEPYTTEWMKVPPPQFDVNIGLTTKSKPEIIAAEKDDDGYVLVFKDCMKPDSVKNLVLTDSSGGNVSYTLEFEDEQSPEGEKLAKEYKLKILSDSPSDTYSLSISNAENYSGIKGDVSYSIKTINDKLDKVNASVESGKVDKGTKVTLSCSEQNADIYYTLDGSDPTKDGSYALRYTEPITLTEDAEIKAYAVCDGYTDSDVSVFSYSVKKYLIGDVNSDGQVNGADAGVLNRYAAGWKDYNIKIKNFDAADINKDGKVNGADAGILARYTSDWKNYEKYFY